MKGPPGLLKASKGELGLRTAEASLTMVVPLFSCLFMCLLAPHLLPVSSPRSEPGEQWEVLGPFLAPACTPYPPLSRTHWAPEHTEGVEMAQTGHCALCRLHSELFLKTCFIHMHIYMYVCMYARHCSK